MGTRTVLLLLVAFVVGAVPTLAAHAQDTSGEVVRIRTVSNRADLISAGDALVEVDLPRGWEADDLEADVDGRDVTSSFALRSNGRIMGLVEDLEVGENVLTVRLPDGRGAYLEIDNHPIGGPVFSGEQLQPWFCDTESEDLGPPVDDQCNAPTLVEFFYRSTDSARPGFQPYDPDDPPSDVATTTTDEGEEVPFIVRRERGTMNRGIYEVAVLYDPSESWEPWAPQAGWNGKLVYPFGASCGTEYRQGSPEDVMDEDKLGAGFMIANSSLNVLGTQCNTIISAEAVMMLQEHIVESHGEIRFTIGEGCSGGSIGQQMVANGYPGLLQGIQPNCSYEDNWTTGLEVVDCHLLLHYFTQVSPHLWPVAQQQAEVMGHASVSTCAAWEGTFANRSDPSGGCSVPEEHRYDPEDNPDGARCTLQDYYIAVLGERPQDGFAKVPYDNIGWQYGLDALNSGLITSEQFVDLNEKIGGLDVDFGFTDDRVVADPGAVETLYRTGQANDAARLDQVAMIDLRGSSNFEFHTDYHSWAMRERLVDANGHHDNQIIWTADTPLLMSPSVYQASFELLDEWLTAVEADPSDAPIEDKIVRNRPADATDACFIGDQRIDDESTCRTRFPYFGAPRIAAGGPLSHDIIKCQLEPLDRDDYQASFTDAQWERLQAAYPDGVCDFTQPADRREASVPWMTFADGPGGRPLGPAPTSVPFGPASSGDEGVAAAPGPLPTTGGPAALTVGGLALIALAMAGRRRGWSATS